MQVPVEQTRGYTPPPRRAAGAEAPRPLAIMSADEQLRALPGKANAKRRWKLARSMLGSKGLWRRAVGGMSAADVLRKSVLKAGEGDNNEQKEQEEEAWKNAGTLEYEDDEDNE